MREPPSPATDTSEPPRWDRSGGGSPVEVVGAGMLATAATVGGRAVVEMSAAGTEANA